MGYKVTQTTKQNEENNAWEKWNYQQRDGNNKNPTETLVLRNT